MDVARSLSGAVEPDLAELFKHLSELVGVNNDVRTIPLKNFHPPQNRRVDNLVARCYSQ